MTQLQSPRRVVHVLTAPYSLYIGRAMPGYRLPASKWANQHRITIHNTRRQALWLYERDIRANNELIAALHEIDGLVLGCWCKKRRPWTTPCHGDVLVRLREEQLRVEALHLMIQHVSGPWTTTAGRLCMLDENHPDQLPGDDDPHPFAGIRYAIPAGTVHYYVERSVEYEHGSGFICQACLNLVKVG